MRPIPRFCRFAAGLSVFLMGVAMAPETTRAAALIDVTITVRNQPFLAGVTEWEIVVKNPGTETLGSLVLTGEVALNTGAITGPTVTVGNADNQLDPGEVWTYSASGPDILGAAGVVVTAMTPASDTVTAQSLITYSLKSPLSGSASTPTPTVPAGTVVEWLVQYENVANFAVTIANAEARVLDPGSGLVPFAPMTPVSKGLDGDELMGPGEIWSWRFAAAITIDGSYLSTAVDFRTVDGSNVFGTPEVRSAPIALSQIVPATTTTSVEGTRVLPETGQSDTGIVWFAMILIAVGAMSWAVARRRVTDSEQQR
jgi:large repetitive protein